MELGLWGDGSPINAHRPWFPFTLSVPASTQMPVTMTAPSTSFLPSLPHSTNTVCSSSDADHARPTSCQKKGQEYCPPSLLAAISGKLATYASACSLGKARSQSATAGRLGSLRPRWRQLGENGDHAGVLEVNGQQYHSRSLQKTAGKQNRDDFARKAHRPIPRPTEALPDFQRAHVVFQYWLHYYD